MLSTFHLAMAFRIRGQWEQCESLLADILWGGGGAMGKQEIMLPIVSVDSHPLPCVQHLRQSGAVSWDGLDVCPHSLPRLGAQSSVTLTTGF